MPRLFVTREQIGGGTLVVDGDAARHLAGPLRVRPGELIEVVDDGGHEHGVRVVSVERARVTGSIIWSRPASGEPRLHLEVIHALVREIDEAIAALAEVGAAAIHPVLALRSVSRPGPERATARLRRWSEIAREAAELAHRAAVPAVRPVTDLGGALAELPKGSRILACMVDAAVPLARLEVDPARPVALVIGPEGGLAPTEIELLCQAGAEMVHLGPRVLPARRAAVVAAGLLLARAGDLDAAAPRPGGGAPPRLLDTQSPHTGGHVSPPP
jgi:16S rRNA (uracil1498-N3)-methyltransferase